MSEHEGRGMGHQTSARVVAQPDREEGIVRAGSTPIEHERPEDWGWHHEWGKKMRGTVVLPLIFIVAMIWGNHRGKVEDIWLIASAAIIVLLYVRAAYHRRNAWRSN